MSTWRVPPRSRRYAPLSGAAKYPAGARPSKCIISIIIITTVASPSPKQTSARARPEGFRQLHPMTPGWVSARLVPRSIGIDSL
jgi:hypothetical protein